MKRFKRFLGTTLLGGLVVILPFTIFVVIMNLIFKFVTNILQPITKIISGSKEMNQIIVNLSALAIVIAFCFMVGLVVKTRFGKNVWHYIEVEWLSKLPFYNIIKETVQQFSGSKKMILEDVILVDPFGTDTWMTGFITDDHGNGQVTVFVPTAPNPTNGFVFHVPKSKLRPLNAEYEDALRSIISIGKGSGEVINADSVVTPQSTESVP